MAGICPEQSKNAKFVEKKYISNVYTQKIQRRIRQNCPKSIYAKELSGTPSVQLVNSQDRCFIKCWSPFQSNGKIILFDPVN